LPEQHIPFTGVLLILTGKATSSAIYSSRQRDNMSALNFKKRQCSGKQSSKKEDQQMRF
jgi:hypothetical protein